MLRGLTWTEYQICDSLDFGFLISVDITSNFVPLFNLPKELTSRSQWLGVGLRPLACWGCGFESHRGHGCLSVCCVLSGRGLCDELITRLEESYRQWCVVVCDLETSWMRRPWTTAGMDVCLSVVCCQVEVSAMSWSLVLRSPTDCGASFYVI